MIMKLLVKFSIFLLSLFIRPIFPNPNISPGSQRFEYKHSFKGPHLVLTEGKIPFWTYHGNAIASDQQIRLTPSLQSQRGSVWNDHPYILGDFDIELVMRIQGRGRVGADGMAFWYTKDKSPIGNVFGSNDLWTGLAIILDSFDNDDRHNNPYISVMINNGTMSYKHHEDGAFQENSGCVKDFRNRAFPVRLKLTYRKNELTIMYYGGSAPKPQRIEEWEFCTKLINVQLPEQGFFGVSAATGGLADDQDVLSFITHSYHSDTPQANQLSAEDEKLIDEYKSRVAELEKDKKNDPNDNVEYQSLYNQEGKMLLDGQNAIRQIIFQLSQKTDQLLGQQLNSNKMINEMVTNPPSGNQANAQLNNQQQQGLQMEIIKKTGDLMNILMNVQNKVNEIVLGKNQKIDNNLIDKATFARYINDLEHNIIREMKKQMKKSGESSSGNIFIIFMVFQCMLVVGAVYFYKRNNSGHEKYF